MTRLNCNICGLVEKRWSGNRHFTTLGGTHNIYYSRSKEGENKGVAFIIDKETAKSISGYSPINEIIISIRINCKPFLVTIIQVYAPTSDADDEDIEYFYNQIERESSQQLPKNDITLVIGDFNANQSFQQGYHGETMGWALQTNMDGDLQNSAKQTF